MGFVEAIKSFYNRYFDFETRSSASEYWWVALFHILAYIVLAVFLGTVIALSANGGGEPSAAGMLLGFGPLVLFFLANIIPGIAVSVRRFHDQDKTGWMYLLIIPSIIPGIGIIFSIIIIVFMCLGGTPGPNRFGPDPLGRGETMEDVFS
ncbi:MAG: DUF805 domain-containing protein [Robiginitomaculum sp.]